MYEFGCVGCGEFPDAETYPCAVCGKKNLDHQTYEYRGAYSCEEHFDEMKAARDHQRSEVISEEQSRLDALKGLDFSPDTPLGRVNREILKPAIETLSKESARRREYEGRA